MYKKIQFTILNIFLLCVAFGIIIFGSLISYADTVRDVDIIFSSRNGTPDSQYGYNNIVTTVTIPSNSRCCLYLSYVNEFNGTPIYTSFFYVSQGGLYTIRRTVTSMPDGNTSSSSGNYSFTTSSENQGVFQNLSQFYGNNSFSVSSNSGIACPIFTDFEDARSYIIDGTLPDKPFDDTIKLDKFKVYMKGEWNWDLVRPQFNTVVVCPIWTNPNINDVEISIYAVDPSYRYNTVNYSYDGNMSGQMQTLDVSGLTLHGQKFVVRATPFTSTTRGVAIQYEFTFPENFDQPIGQLIIPSDNTYPYSTTIDISGNDVPIEWTVTQTPIYVYETNNIENYYYGEPVSYPVPEITENTSNNYYETYVNNYYNTYNEVVNNYDVNFEIDISDVSGSDIQQTYDDFGNFFKGFGGFIGKLALLFSGLFPFLSPLVATTLVTMVGIIVLGAVVILFLKVLHIL